MEEFENKDGGKELRQTQCLAFGDGVDYVKYENNPVITPEMLPEGSSAADFRDPKIWYEEKEDCYYCVIGSSTEEDGGAVVLFRSPDLFNWEYVSTLDKSRNAYGFMWECPDMFRLGDTDFIPLLPMKMFAKGIEFHSGNNAAYLAGLYDKKTHTFVRKGIFSLDYGIDFYAPQSMVTPDGRRIMTAWMQTPETKHATPYGAKWFGQLTFPRELTERDGRLIQNPIRELEACRKDPVFYQDVCIGDRTRLPGVSGRSVDLTVRVKPGGSALYRKFTVKVAEDEELFTSITYDPAESILYFDRSYSGFMHYILSERKAHVRCRGGEITLRFLVDNFSVEVFVNDGEQTMSNKETGSYRKNAGGSYRLHIHFQKRKRLAMPVELQSRDEIRILVGDQETDVLIYRACTFEEMEVSGRDPAAQASVSKDQFAVRITAEGRDALVAQAAGNKEILPVLREADRTADTAVVGRGGLHECLVGRRAADGGDLLHKPVFVTFRIKPISEDRIGHFRQHKEHPRMSVTEGEVPWACSVRQADITARFPQSVSCPVQFIDIDHVQAEVADEDLVLGIREQAAGIKSGKMRMRPLLPVRRIKSNAAVLPMIAE